MDTAPKIFISILENGESNISTISKKIDKTYSHVCKILNEYDCLFDKRKVGRNVFIKLNKNGTDIAKEINKLNDLINKNGI